MKGPYNYGAIKQLWYLNNSYFLPFEQLTSLDLHFNNLAGFVESQGSESLCGLRNLEILDLGFNKFNNSIVSSLRGVPSLKDLRGGHLS